MITVSNTDIQTIFQVIFSNESSGGTAFKLTSPVTATSGYSFGPIQFDLGNNDQALGVLQAVFDAVGTTSAVATAAKNNGNTSVQTVLADLSTYVSSFSTYSAQLSAYNAHPAGSPPVAPTLSKNDIAVVNAALGQDAQSGNQSVLYTRSQDYVTDTLVAATEAVIPSQYQGNSGLALLVTDYFNQYGADTKGPLASFLAGNISVLANQPYSLQIDPDNPVVSVAQYLLSTIYAAKSAQGYIAGTTSSDPAVNRLSNDLAAIVSNGLGGLTDSGNYYFTGPADTSGGESFVYQLSLNGSNVAVNIDPESADEDYSHGFGYNYSIPNTQITANLGQSGSIPGIIYVSSNGEANITGAYGQSSVTVNSSDRITVASYGGNGGTQIVLGTNASGQSIAVQLDSSGNLSYGVGNSTLFTASSGSNFNNNSNSLVTSSVSLAGGTGFSSDLPTTVTLSSNNAGGAALNFPGSVAGSGVQVDLSTGLATFVGNGTTFSELSPGTQLTRGTDGSLTGTTNYSISGGAGVSGGGFSVSVAPVPLLPAVSSVEMTELK